MEPWKFKTWLDLFDHWQTLLTGLLAVGAAGFTVLWTEGYSRRREDREIAGIKASLAVEVRAIVRILLDAHEFLKNAAAILKQREHELAGADSPTQVLIRRGWTELKASTVKAGTELPDPTVFRASADRIGRLGDLAPLVTDFYVWLHRINVGVKVVTVDLTATLGEEQLFEISRLFRHGCQKALPVLSKLPPDVGDADLRQRTKDISWTNKG